jgi:hypothetical protein
MKPMKPKVQKTHTGSPIFVSGGSSTLQNKTAAYTYHISTRRSAPEMIKVTPPSRAGIILAGLLKFHSVIAH